MGDQTFDPSQFGNASKPVATQPKEELPAFEFSPENFRQHQQSLEDAKRQELIELRQLPLGPVKRWSFSGWSNFRNCPYAVKLSKVDGCPDPAGPAADRGNRVHLNIEDFIQGKHDELCKEAKKHFETLIRYLRDQFNDGRVEIEGEWGFDRDWEICQWGSEEAWARVKLDAIEFESPTSAYMYDWKTGRKFGNELKHAEQLQLYAIGAFMRFPELEFVTGEMIYLDKNDRLKAHYTRAEAMEFIDKWNRRGHRMTTTVNFEATPSEHACKWCPHAKVQEGEDGPACTYRHIAN